MDISDIDMLEKKRGPKPGRKPTFELEVVGELPPKEPPRKTYAQLLTNLETIKEYPGEWAQVAHYCSPVGASTVVKKLTAGVLPVAGKYDYESRIHKDDEGNPSESLVYARYIEG